MSTNAMPKPSHLGTTHFGEPSAARRLFGLQPAAFRVVVAVMACEAAEGGVPSRMAIADVSRCDDTGMPSRLVREGWLERANLVGNVAFYRASEKAWATFGVERPVRGVAA